MPEPREGGNYDPQTPPGAEVPGRSHEVLGKERNQLNCSLVQIGAHASSPSSCLRCLCIREIHFLLDRFCHHSMSQGLASVHKELALLVETLLILLK